MYTKIRLEKMTLKSLREVPMFYTIPGRWKLKRDELIDEFLKEVQRKSPSMSLEDKLNKMTVAELRKLPSFVEIPNRWKLKKTDLIEELLKLEPEDLIVAKPKLIVIKEGKLNSPTVSLLEHQKRVIKFITYPRNKSMLVIHSTGAGKTFTGLYSIFSLLKHKQTNVIIVAPPTVLENWKKEIISKGFSEEIPKNFSFLSFDSFITNRSREFIDACKNAIVVIDEVHNLRTKIQQSYGKAYKGKKSYGNYLCIKNAWKVLLMTATPVVNRVQDIQNILAMIHKLNPTDLAIRRVNDIPKLQKFLRDYNTPISYYKAIKNIETGYPGFIIRNEIVTLTASERRRYNEIMSGVIEDWKIGGTLMTFYNSMRMAGDAGFEVYYSPKLKFVKAYIKNHPLKTMVFSSFIGKGVRVIEKMLNEIGCPIYEIIGSVAKQKRQAIIDEFNANDDFKILIISKAGKEGINLRGVRTVFLLEPSWNDVDSYQALSRAVRFQSHIHLPEHQRTVNVYRLFLENSIDTLLQSNYVEKKAAIAVKVESVLEEASY
jgi:DNA or RNA helicases of superfamily II